MTRVEYMKELELLLSDIPAEEREDAISYYNDYFDAGGEENEEATIEALGSPEHLAYTIKNAGLDSENGEFSERGYTSGDYNNEYQMDKYTAVSNSSTSQGNKKEKKEKSAGTIILIIILCIFAFPVLFPILMALLCVMFGLGAAAIAIVFSIVVAIIACGIGALVGGAFCVCAGITTLIANPYGSLVVIGFGLLALAAGVLFCLGCVALVVKVVPPVLRWIVNILRKPIDWLINRRNKKSIE